MPYYKLLRKVVANTNYTQEEIAKRCTELGEKISKSYLNKLLNNKQQAPTEEISRVIAKVCNCDERLLVIEGYLDKAPKEIKNAFLSIKNTTMLYSINMFENEVDNKTLNEIKEIFEEQPLTDFIIELIDSGKSIINMKELGFEIKSENKKVICDLTKPISFKIEDNSMFPFIKENDEITIEIKDRYINGDIIVATVKGQKGIIIRQASFLGTQIELAPFNKKYKHTTYNKEELTILGKVKKIITEI